MLCGDAGGCHQTVHAGGQGGEYSVAGVLDRDAVVRTDVQALRGVPVDLGVGLLPAHLRPGHDGEGSGQLGSHGQPERGAHGLLRTAGGHRELPPGVSGLGGQATNPGPRLHRPRVEQGQIRTGLVPVPGADREHPRLPTARRGDPGPEVRIVVQAGQALRAARDPQLARVLGGSPCPGHAQLGPHLVERAEMTALFGVHQDAVAVEDQGRHRCSFAGGGRCSWLPVGPVRRALCTGVRRTGLGQKQAR